MWPLANWRHASIHFPFDKKQENCNQQGEVLIESLKSFDCSFRLVCERIAVGDYDKHNHCHFSWIAATPEHGTTC